MTRNTREATTRAHEMRETYDVDYVNPLEVPPEVMKEGYEYGWVNLGIKGAPSYKIEEKAAKGWTLVPVERSTRRCFDPLGRNPMYAKYICHKDVILMERLKIYGDREREALHQKNSNQIRSLRGVANDSPVFPSSFNSITTF